jgi:hypothetical protein
VGVFNLTGRIDKIRFVFLYVWPIPLTRTEFAKLAATERHENKLVINCTYIFDIFIYLNK